MTTAIRASAARAAEDHLAQLRAACGAEALRPTIDAYLRNLRAVAGTEIGRADAVDLLTLHAIAKPVFDALFTTPYPFTEQTRISRALAPALRALDAVTDNSGTAPLHGPYQAGPRPGRCGHEPLRAAVIDLCPVRALLPHRAPARRRSARHRLHADRSRRLHPPQQRPSAPAIPRLRARR